jgi:hypothetical protein
MRDKKKSKSEKTSEQDALVQRVDSMMSTELPAATPPKPVVMADEPDDDGAGDKKSEVIAPKTQKTAPELLTEPLKDTEAEESPDETPEEPVDDAEPEPAETEAAPAETDEPPQAPAKDPLEDSATDQAVDDIVSHEGDTVLAVDDALTARKQATAEPGQPSGPHSSHKTFWIIILIVLLGTAADAAIYLLRR